MPTRGTWPGRTVSRSPEGAGPAPPKVLETLRGAAKLRHLPALALLVAVFATSIARAETATLCTAVADAATGEVIRQEGACDTSVTAASTFKIAISRMGYDSGFLKEIGRASCRERVCQAG